MGERAGAPAGAGILLPSKVRMPARADALVERPRVAAKLERALAARLTLLVAPAGFGKTTAVLSWASRLRDAAVAWYAVGPEDSTVDRFWLYIAGALASADPALTGVLDEDALLDTFSKSLPAIDAAIVRLYGYERPVVLVLEDLHEIARADEVMESLRYFVRHMPPNVHVVATTRRGPALPLAKMRVEGTLVEIDEADLAFEPAQIERFFGGAGCALAPDELEQAAELTRGWPAGCRLLALLLGSAGTRATSLALARARDSLQDYLFEEVLSSLPEDLVAFMVQTSLVDSFCLSLARAITGRTLEQTAAAVDAVVDGALFVERIERSEGEEWYRYQPLLADLLRNRAARLGHDELRGTFERIYGWYEERGYYEAVVEVAARLSDFATIRRLIAENWERLYRDDAHYVLLRWASHLPPAELHASPFACAALAVPFALRGEMDEANACIMHAIHGLKDDEDFLFAFCVVQKAYLASFAGKVDDMRVLAEKALAYLPEREVFLRGMMTQIVAASSLERRPLEAYGLFRQVLVQQRPLQSRPLTCSALCNLAIVCADLGHLAEAERYATEALGLFGASERAGKPMLSYAWLALSLVRYERGDLEGSRSACDAARELMRDVGMADKRAEAAAQRAKLLVRQGDDALAAARAWQDALALNELGACHARPSLALVRPSAAAHAPHSLARLDDPAAPAAIRLFDLAVAFHTDPAAWRARACSFADGIDERERLLCIHADALAAAFCEAAAHPQAADRHLERAVRRAREHGLPSALADNAAYLEPALRRLAGRTDDSELAAFARGLLAAPDTGADDAARLTEREVDALRQVAAGLTLAQAAEAMVVSRETVKKHLANAYAKLGVHSKMQAVALLRERGVL